MKKFLLLSTALIMMISVLTGCSVVYRIVGKAAHIVFPQLVPEVRLPTPTPRYDFSALPQVIGTPQPTPKITVNLEATYAEAAAAYDGNRDATAYALFSRCGDYKDSKSRAAALRYVLHYYPIYGNGDMYINSEGKIVPSPGSKYKNAPFVTEWTGLRSFSDGYPGMVIAVRSDGTVAAYNEYNDSAIDKNTVAQITQWKNIVQVVSKPNLCVGLRSDGTVAVTDILYGTNMYADVKNWTDIIQLTFYEDVLFGLKSDGTLIASSFQLAQLPDGVKSFMNEWRNISMITGKVALENTGRAFATLFIPKEYVPSTWADVKAVFGGQYNTDDKAYFVLMDDETRVDNVISDIYGNIDFNYKNAVFVKRIGTGDGISSTYHVVVSNDGIVIIDYVSWDTSFNPDIYMLPGGTKVITPRQIAQ